MKLQLLKQNNIFTILLITFSGILPNCQTGERCSEDNLNQFIESGKVNSIEDCIINRFDPEFEQG